MGDVEVPKGELTPTQFLPQGVADERFAVNVRDVRERMGLSQTEVARQMAARGWAYYPQTMQRVEAGQRKVSVGEAEALASILHTTMERLTWPGELASAASLLDTFTDHARQAYSEITRWTAALLFAQRQLATTVAEAERNALGGSDQLGALVAEARAAMTLESEAAVTTGSADFEEAVTAVPAGRPGLQALPGPQHQPDGNCVIVFMDVVAFSSRVRNDEDRRIIRHELLGITAASFAPVWDQCFVEDRGDGLLLVAPPGVPLIPILECLHDALPRALRRHNRIYGAGPQIQLRVAVDVGPVTSDGLGISGKVIIHAARLLEAPALKHAMSSRMANLGVMVSDFVYQTAVRDSDLLGDPDSFTEVSVNAKEIALRAWMLMVDPTPPPQ